MKNKCRCVYVKDKQIGLCLRCAKMILEAHLKGERAIYRKLTKVYNEAGRPHWFFNEDDLEELRKSVY